LHQLLLDLILLLAEAAFQQERPDGGWQHKGGKKVSDIQVVLTQGNWVDLLRKTAGPICFVNMS
jgi:hypothetical protein